ncbi:MAG: hypothetical protein O3A84_17055 [Proteobacteria bacterium]|nr:hypothetical protein [Pseudomonadota bacterium]
MSFSFRHLALALPLLLGGCVFYDPAIDPDSSIRASFEEAAAAPNFYVQLVSPPPDQTSKGLGAIAMTAFQRNHARMGTRFTTDDQGPFVTPYKIVIAFDPPSGMQDDDICRRPDVVIPEPGTLTLRIVALFCGDKAISVLGARIWPRPNEGETAEISEAINFLAWQLIPENAPIE